MAMKKAETTCTSLNIQAYIRIRPLNLNEKRSPFLEFGRRDITIKSSSDASRKKILTFDRVFEEEAKQIAVYNAVVQPMIKEVLLGYNCTVFAYGQTGTGKTYTMAGDQGNNEDMTFEDNMHAGIIPRTMKEIFDQLNNQPLEYQVTVSYLELYNEKLRNLLGAPEDDFCNIQLIDDSEGGILLRGFDPTPVKSKDEAFKLLEAGAQKKQIASTNMNSNSSRSHTIFTISIKIREALPGDKEDIVRLGKLHLVDLAGSENVSKSGANDLSNKANGVNRRLTEASNINRSLLTLGRVITSITENNPHIPYRESKLTRILRDSLGGKTKTCIIGTISPAQLNLDETESTLNYAYKARSIKNKPEKNKIISKKGFMQGASEEIMKLKRDLEAMRHGDGFYISKESHDEMCNTIKSLDTQVQMWRDRYNTLSDKHEEMKILLSNTSVSLDEKCAEYEELERIHVAECERNREKLSELNNVVRGQEITIDAYKKTVANLTEETIQLKSVIGALHEKIQRKCNNENNNKELNQNFKLKISTRLDEFENYLQEFNNKEMDFANGVSTFITKIHDNMNDENESIMKQFKLFGERINLFTQEANKLVSNTNSEISNELVSVRDAVDKRQNICAELLGCVVSRVLDPLAKVVESQVQFMRKCTQDHQETFKEFLGQVQAIKDDSVKSNDVLKLTFSKIIEECEDLAHKISIETGVRKVQEDKEAQVLKTLKWCVQQMSQETGVKGIQKLEEFSLTAKNLSKKINTEFSAYNSESNVSANKYEDIFKRVEESESVAFNQVVEGAVRIKEASNQYLSDAKEIVDHNMRDLRSQTEVELSKVTSCVDLMKTCSDTFSEQNKVFENQVSDYNVIVRELLSVKKEDYEITLREEHSRSLANKNTVQENKTFVKEQIKEINSDIQDFNYISYVPCGETPQRVTEEDKNSRNNSTEALTPGCASHAPCVNETYMVENSNAEATFISRARIRRSVSDSELNEAKLFRHPSGNLEGKTDSLLSLPQSEDLENKENSAQKKRTMSRKKNAVNATKITPSGTKQSSRPLRVPLSTSNK